MIFGVELTVSANTAKEEPESTTLKLTACVLRKLSVDFPIGCYWLVGTRILWRDHQLYPTNPDAWLVGNGRVIETQDNYPLSDTPNEVTIEAYNLDERYDHTLRIYFDADVLSPLSPEMPAVDIYTGYA